MKHHYASQGFIALTSSIIISIVLMTLVLTVSTSSFYARADALGKENKHASLVLAESCVHTALFRLREDPFYEPVLSGDIVQIGEQQCTIISVTRSLPVYPKPIKIKTKGERLGAWSNIEVNITMQNPDMPPTGTPPPSSVVIDSWEEIPAIP